LDLDASVAVVFIGVHLRGGRLDYVPRESLL